MRVLVVPHVGAVRALGVTGDRGRAVLCPTFVDDRVPAGVPCAFVRVRDTHRGGHVAHGKVRYTVEDGKSRVGALKELV